MINTLIQRVIQARFLESLRNVSGRHTDQYKAGFAEGKAQCSGD